MVMFQADPTAEASVGFSDVRPGKYPMRITDAAEGVGKESGEPNIKWRLEHSTPREGLVDQQGKPLTGFPSGLFYYTQTAAGKQGMLRGLTEAALGEWRAADTSEF